FVPPAPVTDRVACAIRTLSKPDTVSAAENWGDRDEAWPAVAAQLRGTVGSAPRSTILATAALALSQVDLVIRAVGHSGDPRGAPAPPPTLDTTLELDADGYSISARRWTRHPACSC
ncbi:hypothetical protein LOC73_36680, partial [Mycolicibacterium mageritense]|nr:hypothetical protein [Mycolicibacterium mageritense]